MLKIFNTLSGKIEEFHPMFENHVGMYVCGITPYDEMHLGHARCYVTFDILRRLLEFESYEVIHVQNFTDIDDKIINKARQLNMDFRTLASKYIKEYKAHCEKLNIIPPKIEPLVTEHIPQIINFVEKLINKGIAYVSNGNVYFSVDKFEGYGKLSKKKLNEMLIGARVEPDERKNNPLDFALWKKAKPEEPFWDSPWGKGRPGWHIECSAMSMEYLGERFDIHGGGQDLIFPHHENEIAQSESLTSKPFVNYWIHNGFVTINKEKMSKSLGNIFSLNDVFKYYDPMEVRFFLISSHYRSEIDFSNDAMIQAKNSWEKIIRVREIAKYTMNFLPEEEIKKNEQIELDTLFNQFITAVESDLNTPVAVSVIHRMVDRLFLIETRRKNVTKGYIKYALEILDKSINLLGLLPPASIELDQESLILIEKRQQAREKKDYKTADEIRDLLKSKGIILEDTEYGTRWRKI